VFVSIAFLGVGAGVRRDLSATLERLGIRFPTVGDWVSGGITALLCLAVLVVFSLWNQAINPTEITDQQAIASDQLMVALGQSYAMVGLAALSAGVGKRCYFGGRYNPCLGFCPPAIFFGLLHSQYLFTPLLLLVILLGCVMGMLRRLRNTTSAIIAHFSYNFIQLTLFIWANNLHNPFRFEWVEPIGKSAAVKHFLTDLLIEPILQLQADLPTNHTLTLWALAWQPTCPTPSHNLTGWRRVFTHDLASDPSHEPSPPHAFAFTRSVSLLPCF
jgi:hypothetical protein